MASSSAYQDLKDFVTCGVCYNLFEGRAPLSLPCLHTFCSPCIQGIVDATCEDIPDEIKCPICQTYATIPEGIVSNLPAYFPSSKLQSILKQMEPKRSICKLCEASGLASYCFQCSIAMCEDCQSKHDHHHNNHVLVNVTDSTIAHVMCAEHEKHVEALCIECSRSVCRVCSLTTHSDHELRAIAWDTEDGTNVLDQLFAGHMESVDQRLSKLCSLLGEFNADTDESISELDRHHDDAIKQLQQQHESFRAQLQQRRDQVNQDLGKVNSLLEQAKDCIMRLQRQAETFRRPTPAIPDASFNDTQKLIEGIKGQLSSIDVPKEQPCRLVFIPSGPVCLGDISEEMELFTVTSVYLIHDGTKPKIKLKTKPCVEEDITEPFTTGNPYNIPDIFCYLGSGPGVMRRFSLPKQFVAHMWFNWPNIYTLLLEI